MATRSRRLLAVVAVDLLLLPVAVVALAHRSATPAIGPWSWPWAAFVAVNLVGLGALHLLLLHPRTAAASGRVVGRLGLVAAGLGLALVVAEAALRRWPPARFLPPPIPGAVASASLFEPDPVLHHVFRRAARVCYQGPEFDTEVVTSDHGFRDAERRPGPAAASRVAVLGDSHVAGLEVEAGEAWPARLERLLAARGWAVEVLNFGVPAYSPALETRQLSDVVLAFEPRLVVLVLSTNDVYEDRFYARRYRCDEQGGLVIEGRPAPVGLGRALDGARVALERTALGRLVADRLFAWRHRHRAAWGWAPIFAERYRPDDRRAFDFTLQQVERTALLAATAGARFAVVAMPAPHQVHADEWDRGKARFGWAAGDVVGDHPQRYARRRLEAAGIRFFDLLPELRARRSGRLFFRLDTHLDVAGHRLVAEVLADWLAGAASDLLPPGREAAPGPAATPSPPGE